MQFSAETTEKIKTIRTHFPEDKQQAALIPVLHMAQREFKALTPEVEELVSKTLGLPIVKVREVVSFYEMLHQKPIGKYHFQVCWNISCSLLGAEHIIDFLSRRLGIQPGEVTSDGRFSLWGMECLGACSEAPVMLLNEELYQNLTEEKLDRMLKELGIKEDTYTPENSTPEPKSTEAP
jgi:NADH-quinone oxidoreductase E subunit